MRSVCVLEEEERTLNCVSLELRVIHSFAVVLLVLAPVLTRVVVACVEPSHVALRRSCDLRLEHTPDRHKFLFSLQHENSWD